MKKEEGMDLIYRPPATVTAVTPERWRWIGEKSTVEMDEDRSVEENLREGTGGARSFAARRELSGSSGERDEI